MADLIPPKRNEFLTKEGIATKRFDEYLKAITDQTNSNTTVVITASDNTGVALLFALENRIGSGDALTSDETGFSVDSTKLTVDMTEA